jgi:hypothetical protein
LTDQWIKHAARALLKRHLFCTTRGCSVADVGAPDQDIICSSYPDCQDVETVRFAANRPPPGTTQSEKTIIPFAGACDLQKKGDSNGLWP